MSSTVIEKFEKNCIAVMALPAHTSDRLQPLDVSVFCPFKHGSNKSVDERVRSSSIVSGGGVRFGGLDVRRCIHSGYQSSFTANNIESGFKKTGLWPFDPCTVCAKDVRASHTNALLVSPTALNTNIRRYFTKFKRQGLPDPLVRPGFICTQIGIELTRPDVRLELRLLELDRARKRKDLEEAEANKAAELCEIRAGKSKRRDLIEVSKALDRVRRHGHGLPFSLPRPLHERRKVARANALKRRYEAVMKKSEESSLQ